MASEWGAEPTGAGKVVWFELRPGSGFSPSFALEADALSDLAELAGLATSAGAPAAGTEEPDRDPGDHVVCRGRRVSAGARP
jgi:hypothetical protein